MNCISDLVKSRNSNKLYLIVDVENFHGEHYMFHLYDLSACNCESWFEPFEDKLNSSYWETLA